MRLNTKQLKRKKKPYKHQPVPLKIYGQPIINVAIVVAKAFNFGNNIITRLTIDPPIDYQEMAENMEVSIRSALTGIPFAKLIRPYQLKRKKEELDKKANNPNYSRKKLAKEQRYYDNELQEYQLSQV